MKKKTFAEIANELLKQGMKNRAEVLRRNIEEGFTMEIDPEPIKLNDLYVSCPFCKQPTDHLSIDYETEYNNKLCDLIADKIINAIEEQTPNFGSEKLNKIVRLAIEKQTMFNS